MKNSARFLSLLLCLAMMLSILSSCIDINSILGGNSSEVEENLPPENEVPPVIEGWTPSGETITVANTSTASKFAPVVSSANKKITKEAMNSLISLLGANGLKGFTSDPAEPSEDNTGWELIIGESDREASVTAKALLDEKSAASPDDLHWVFHYYAGKLAIIANSSSAYEIAIEDLAAKYISGGSFSFADTLKDYGTMTKADYNAKLDAAHNANADLLKDERDKLLAALMPSYEAQRNEIAANESFGTATEDIGALDPSWSTRWGAAPTTPINEHPRLLITSSDIPLIRKNLRDDTATNARYYALLNSTHPTEGKLGEVKTNFDGRAGVHNYDKSVLELIQVKALAYLVEGHDLYGYQAIYYMKNFLLTLDIQYISSDQCREYGCAMMTAAIVYDWCYDLLTEEDKAQLIAATETRTASGYCGDPSYTTAEVYKKKQEVGFPPKDQGAVVGHGSEGQVLRNYLSAAIAFYGDNNSWWDYVAARIYSEFVPVRNYYFQSGISQQGTGMYIGVRHVSDLYSAWLLIAATGDNPYDNIHNTMRNFLGYECAPGQIFTDGDGTHDMRPTSTTYLLAAVCIAAYVFEDATLIAQSEHILGNNQIGMTSDYLSTAVYIALCGLTETEPADDRYEGMDLIQYNGHPVGQYLVHQSWNDESSPAVFMRIKERHTANHEHGDAGTFEIYYKGMLTADGGCYKDYGSAHMAMYHQATISHNGLIIFDTQKWNYNSPNIEEKWYSGSQRTVTDANTLASWLNPSFDTGVVTGRQHGYADEAETKPVYAYIAGDITKAYAADTATYVGRRMLTVYTGDEDFPMAFFVYDSIKSYKAKSEKRFLLQIVSKDAPTLGTDENKNTTVTTVNGDGKLVLTVLGKDNEVNLVGGRNQGSYNSTLSKNYLINGYQAASNGNADDGHWGRVEVVWTEETAEASFMNVIYVTDKDNDSVATVRKTGNEKGLTGGVFNKKIAALFVTSSERATDTVSCRTFGDSKVDLDYYVSGVAAGDWTVTVNDKLIGTFSATEEGGLLTFTAPAGTVEISPAK